MSKYIYGKYTADNVPRIESNEFHTLSMFLGAYLFYSESSEYKSFKEFAKENGLLDQANQEKYYWSFINKAQIFIRDKLNEKKMNRYYMSRRQVRKLGFSGIGAPRMYPKKGAIIQNEMFKYVFENEYLAEVQELFMDFVYRKWMKNNHIPIFFRAEGGDEAVKNAFVRFISFQSELLNGSIFGEKFIVELEKSNTYEIVQQELESRRKE